MSISIKENIFQVLPNLASGTVDGILQVLAEAGVETKDDLSLVEEDDLRSILRPIQIRKLRNFWRCASDVQPAANASDLNNVVQPSTSGIDAMLDSSSVMTSSTSPINPNWAHEFAIPLENMSRRDIINVVENQARPTPRARREMVRIVIDAVMMMSHRPGKKALDIIAREIVAKYPQSFQDIIEGTLVGSGHESLFKQLVNRSEQLNRKVNPSSIESGVARDISTTKEDETRQAKNIRYDDYGCISFNPDIPVGDTKEAQQAIASTLKEMFLQKGTEGHYEQLMRKSYYLQRQDILSGVNIVALKKNWPYLFESSGLFIHFEELTGVNMREQVQATHQSRAQRILLWMDRQVKSRDIIQINMDYKSAKLNSGNTPSELPAAVLGAMAYFKEKQDVLFKVFKDEKSVQEIEDSGLHLHPHIVINGAESTLTASSFMLALDGTVVMENLMTFTTGLSALFATYYCFNYKYPPEAAAALEFIQRCFVRINPGRGTKVIVEKNRKRYAMNSKVLSFINGLADFEWTEM